jgi:hypothetical protein
MLGKIYTNIRDRKKNNLPTASPYMYFDLDTLYSYYTFINDIFQGKFFKNSAQFEKAVADAKLKLLNNSGTDKVGYYNVQRPISCLIDPKKPLAMTFEKTMSPSAFDRRYDFDFCATTIDGFMDARHDHIKPKEIKPAKPKQIPVTQTPKVKQEPVDPDHNIGDDGQMSWKF